MASKVKIEIVTIIIVIIHNSISNDTSSTYEIYFKCGLILVYPIIKFGTEVSGVTL